jgi:uncharacterized protein with NRDE domain
VCLIALAHRVSEQYPLIIAANRDEDYERPTRDAHYWLDAPDVLGGRDALLEGTWLAISRSGRFAAVTNLRGAEPRQQSRGFLVRDFVTGTTGPRQYAGEVQLRADEYAGFHLIAGVIEGEAVHVTGETLNELSPGIYAISNSPAGETWPKAGVAIERVERVLQLKTLTSVVDDLMQFLGEPRGSASPETEVFVSGDHYGTRSSTVIVATADEVAFAEQSYGPGGTLTGERRSFTFAR